MVQATSQSTAMSSSVPLDSQLQEVKGPSDDDLLMDATWPGACPISSEQNIISIVCGKPYHSWALHGNLIQNQYHPSLFWKTAQVGRSACRKKSNDKHELYELLPTHVRSMIYGPKLTEMPQSSNPDVTSSLQTEQHDPAKESEAKDDEDLDKDTLRCEIEAVLSNSTTIAQQDPVKDSEAKDNEDLNIDNSRCEIEEVLSNSTTKLLATNSSGLETKSLSSLSDDAAFYTAQRAVAYRATLRIPAISVYIIGKDNNQVLALARLFRKIPCKIFRLKKDDFVVPISVLEHDPRLQLKTPITPKSFDDDYRWIDMHRLCLLRGSQCLQYPQKSLLIVDTGHGSPISYTATDESGTLIGGGTTMSIDMKLQALSQQRNRGSPYVTKEYLQKYVQDFQSRTIESTKTELDICPLSSSKSIAETVLKETVLSMSKIIVKWMNEIHLKIDAKQIPEARAANTPDKATATSIISSVKSPTKVSNVEAPILILTGNDAELIWQLLISNSIRFRDFAESDMISTINGAVSSGLMKVEVVKTAYLLHHGIQLMLLQQEKVKAVHPNEDVRDVLVGQRVAMIPSASDSEISALVTSDDNLAESSNLVFGSVINIFRYAYELDKDYYSIFWDESCTIDDVEPIRLHDCLILYTKAEEHTRETDENKRRQLSQKSEEAQNAATSLVQRCLTVRTIVHQRLREAGKRIEISAFATDFELNEDIVGSGMVVSGTPTLTKPLSTSTTKKKKPKADAKIPSVRSSSKLNKKKVPTSESETPTSVSSDEKYVKQKSKYKRTSPDKKKRPVTTPESQESQESPIVRRDGPYVNRRTAKDFDGVIYYGFVKSYIPADENEDGIDLWTIEYDDGDSEDLEEEELVDGFILWKKYAADDEIGMAQKKKRQMKKELKLSSEDPVGSSKKKRKHSDASEDQFDSSKKKKKNSVKISGSMIKKQRKHEHDEHTPKKMGRPRKSK